MKTTLFIFSILFILSSLSQAAPFQELTGQSLAEKQIKWLWTHRQMLIKSCQFDSSGCTSNPKVAELVHQLPKLILTHENLEIHFLSEKENPGFFTSNQGEAHRVAMTSLVPEEPIYFNTDLINTLSLSQLTGILFHELTHKLGVVDDNQRLPDQVGAAFANHLQQGLQIGTLPLRNGKKIEMASFRVSLKSNLTGDDFDLGPIRGFGFLTDSNLFIDLDYSKFELAPACSEPGMQLAAQFLRPPVWRPVRNDQKRMRGIVIVNNMCVNVRTGKFEMVPRSLSADIKTSDLGLINSSDVTSKLTEDLESFIDYYSTIELLNAQVPSEPVQAGSELKITLKVRNRGESTATQCHASYVHGDITQVGADGVSENFQTCHVRSLGNAEYEIELRTQLAPTLLSGTYRLPILRLTTNNSNEASFLRLDSEVSWKVDGAKPSAIRLQDPKVIGLRSFTNLGQYKVQDSFAFSRGQRFTVEIEINTTEPLVFTAFGITAQIQMGSELVSSPARSTPDDFKTMIQSYRFSPKGRGQVLQIEFLLPDRFLNAPLWGFRLDEVLVQNPHSKEIGLYRNTQDYRYLILIDKLVDLNQ